MAVLQKLRGWGIVLSLLVALPLLLFIIDPSQIMQTVQSVSSRNNVGKIGNKPVSYMDFQQDVDRFQNIAEIMTGNSASGEEAQKQARDAAWQENIDRYLFVPAAEAAGIQVGKEEMLELTAGESVSPIMANNPYFVDETGAFSADRLRDFIDAVNSGNADPRFSAYWEYLQSAIKTGQFYTKYNALFTASNYENPLMLEKAIEGNNNTADVEFVMVPLGYAVDSTVVVSDKEIRDYYNAHKDFFKQQASRDIEYAVFEVVPSEQDIAAEGKCVVRIDDKVVFVPFVVPGDVVDLQVRKKRKSYCEAEVIRLILVLIGVCQSVGRATGEHVVGHLQVNRLFALREHHVIHCGDLFGDILGELGCFLAELFLFLAKSFPHVLVATATHVLNRFPSKLGFLKGRDGARNIHNDLVIDLVVVLLATIQNRLNTLLVVLEEDDLSTVLLVYGHGFLKGINHVVPCDLLLACIDDPPSVQSTGEIDSAIQDRSIRNGLSFGHIDPPSTAYIRKRRRTNDFSLSSVF